MINGTDKISDFPSKFNKLELDVKKLTKNTHGIKVATWITAVSTAIIAIIGFLSFLR